MNYENGTGRKDSGCVPKESIPVGLKSVSKENIANYVRRCRNYMFAYLEGSAVGAELEEKINQYESVSYTSHRRVGVND
jgi:hypothetical protein